VPDETSVAELMLPQQQLAVSFIYLIGNLLISASAQVPGDRYAVLLLDLLSIMRSPTPGSFYSLAPSLDFRYQTNCRSSYDGDTSRSWTSPATWRDVTTDGGGNEAGDERL
jgi:hypothetical protein